MTITDINPKQILIVIVISTKGNDFPAIIHTTELKILIICGNSDQIKSMK